MKGAGVKNLFCFVTAELFKNTDQSNIRKLFHGLAILFELAFASSRNRLFIHPGSVWNIRSNFNAVLLFSKIATFSHSYYVVPNKTSFFKYLDSDQCVTHWHFYCVDLSCIEWMYLSFELLFVNTHLTLLVVIMVTPKIYELTRRTSILPATCLITNTYCYFSTQTYLRPLYSLTIINSCSPWFNVM